MILKKHLLLIGFALALVAASCSKSDIKTGLENKETFTLNFPADGTPLNKLSILEVESGKDIFNMFA